MSTEANNHIYNAKTNHSRVCKYAKCYNGFILRRILKCIKHAGSNSILDFGCANGFFMEQVANNTKKDICGIEIDPEFIEICRKKNLKTYTNINDTLKNFDFIYSMNVLEHIEDDVSTLKDMHNKLNNNGKLLLYVPAFDFLFTSIDVLAGHYRRYDKNNLINKLEISGFKILKCEYCDSVGVIATLVYKLLNNFKNTQAGEISSLQIILFDMFFPISRLLDKILFSKLAGKNIFILAQKDS